jgi:hypothetical protein
MTIGGAVNPRTTAKTGDFTIETFDSKGNQIDKGYNTSTRMTQVNKIKNMSVQSGSQENGVFTDYTFSLQTNYPLSPGDVLSYKFPSDIMPP